MGQLADLGLPGKWPSKWCVCACVRYRQFELKPLGDGKPLPMQPIPQNSYNCSYPPYDPNEHRNQMVCC